MILVFQIAAGIVIAAIVIFLAYALLLNWVADEPARRQARETAARYKDEQRKLKQEKRAYFLQNPSAALNTWWLNNRPFRRYLAVYLLIVIIVLGWIILGEEGLLPSFLQRLWNG